MSKQAKQTQGDLITKRMEHLLDCTNLSKTEIYTKIADEFGFPRPTIRRQSQHLLHVYEARIQKLQKTYKDPLERIPQIESPIIIQS